MNFPEGPFLFTAITDRFSIRTATFVELSEGLLLASITDASFNALLVDSSTCAKNYTYYTLNFFSVFSDSPTSHKENHVHCC